MIDMSTWEQLEVDVVEGVRLDPKNIRLDIPEGVPEVDIIQDLFHNEKALSLVESIAKLGLLTHELPIVLMRDDVPYVVEGNRRLAALKAIQNPYLAPEFQARIRKFAEDIPSRDALRKIRVLKAPTQDDADQLIAALHTGSQRVGWSPTRQAAFFQAQIDNGKSVDYLIARYPTIDVKKFVIRSQILSLFRNVEYNDPSLKDFVMKRRFPVSTLARLYEYGSFLTLAGIEVDEQVPSVTLRLKPKVFARLAEKIIRDIADSDSETHINTRKLNRKDGPFFVNYMKALREVIDEAEADFALDPGDDETVPPASGPNGNGNRPGGGAGGSGGSGNTGGNAGASARDGEQEGAGSGQGPGEAGTTNSGSKPPKTKSAYLWTEDLSAPADYPPAIGMILTELGRINIDKFPNASLDLIRTFLEKLTKAYAARLGVDLKRHTGKDGGFVYLSTCMKWLEQHVKDIDETALIQVVLKVKSGKLSGYVPSMDHLNAINHNHQIFATSDEARECWQMIHGLIRLMLKP